MKFVQTKEEFSPNQERIIAMSTIERKPNLRDAALIIISFFLMLSMSFIIFNGANSPDEELPVYENFFRICALILSSVLAIIGILVFVLEGHVFRVRLKHNNGMDWHWVD